MMQTRNKYRICIICLSLKCRLKDITMLLIQGKTKNHNNSPINILPYFLPFLSDFIIFAIILRNTIYGNLGHIHKK